MAVNFKSTGSIPFDLKFDIGDLQHIEFNGVKYIQAERAIPLQKDAKGNEYIDVLVWQNGNDIKIAHELPDAPTTEYIEDDMKMARQNFNANASIREMRTMIPEELEVRIMRIMQGRSES